MPPVRAFPSTGAAQARAFGRLYRFFFPLAPFPAPAAFLSAFSAAGMMHGGLQKSANVNEGLDARAHSLFAAFNTD